MNKKSPCILWLEKEYPHGIVLVYTDQNDYFTDPDDLEKAVHGLYDGYSEWIADAQWEGMNGILTECPIKDLTSSDEDLMREWMMDHDTSDQGTDMLKHTGSKLFFIQTETDALTGLQGKERDKHRRDLKDLYTHQGDRQAQCKEIDYIMDNQFYDDVISFYFYANCYALAKAIAAGLPIQINGAFIANVDRIQGSNWMGEKPVFNIVLPPGGENIMLDDLHGYGWKDIAGWCPDNGDECSVSNYKGKIAPHDALNLFPVQSAAIRREKRLEDAWQASGHKKCVLGDMNYKRHVGPQNYSMDFPCGNKCASCGTFWID